MCRHYSSRGPCVIAEDLGRSYAAVTAKAYLLGITGRTGHGGRHPNRRLSVEQVSLALRRRQGRGRISAAARDLRVSRTTLRDYMQRHPEVDHVLPNAPAQ